MTQLRSATSQDHDAVEGSIQIMSETLDRHTYTALLQRMHGIVASWETFASQVASPSLQSLVLDRQRRLLLEQDLRYLGADLPHDMVELQLPNTESALLGAMYVMEGSRLGGQLIARHVERVLQFEDGRGTAYFRGFGDATALRWKEVVQTLQTRVSDSDADSVILAAKSMFRAFGDWMRTGSNECVSLTSAR